jgi:hypothetical protein
MTDHFVVLGLAELRSPWSEALARMSTSGVLPIEFVKCIGIDELRARLASGRRYSALLLGAGVPEADRDLIAVARDSGCPVMIIEDPRVVRPWTTLGAAAVLPSSPTRHDILDALHSFGRPVQVIEHTRFETEPDETPSHLGDLIAVTGVPGTGISTVAIAIAQSLAQAAQYRGHCVLADFALDADQAMLHDTGDVLPGVQELVDAHRIGKLSRSQVRALTYSLANRRYDLLLGMRRHRDWASMRSRAFEASLDSLRRAYRLVVADVDSDVEGEAQTGSHDVQDRNLLARHTTQAADIVAVVGTGNVHGIHRMVRAIGDLIEVGVDADRIVPIVNSAPRSARQRAAVARTLTDLLDRNRTFAGTLATDLAVSSPLWLSHRPRVDRSLLEGIALPADFGGHLARSLIAIMRHHGSRSDRQAGGPIPVTPGSLGHWAHTA